MSKVIEMPGTIVTKQRPELSGHIDIAQADKANFVYRLFLAVDLGVYGMIVWLKDVLEAPSFGDVVRQAVRAYAMNLVETGRINENRNLPAPEDVSGKGKKLNIRIPNRTKQRLDMLQDLTGLTYTGIVVTGLGILMRSAEEQEAILAKLEKGDHFVRTIGKTKPGSDTTAKTTCVRTDPETSACSEQIDDTKRAMA